MIQASLYEKEKEKLLKIHPGKAHSLFINWDALAACLDFNYQEQLAEFQISNSSLVDYAFIKTKEYTDQISDELDEEELLEIENQYLKALKKHWSLPNILLRHLDFKKFGETINVWAKEGPKTNTFIVPPKKGFSFDYFNNSFGVSFTIYEPFMIPHSELYYYLHDILPEWNFEDIEAEDIIETYLWLERYHGNDMIIDLSDWDVKLQ